MEWGREVEGENERASLGQDSRLGYKRGMKIEFLPASASTLTRGALCSYAWDLEAKWRL